VREERALDGGSKRRVSRTKLAGKSETCLARCRPRSGQDQRHTTAGSKDDPASPIATMVDQGANHRICALGSLQKVQNAHRVLLVSGVPGARDAPLWQNVAGARIQHQKKMLGACWPPSYGIQPGTAAACWIHVATCASSSTSASWMSR
jgi:hypothetical protein